MAASEILENMSPNYHDIDPCESFDKYVCEGFDEKHDLRADQGSLFTGSLMAENAQQILRHVLESPFSDANSAIASTADRQIFGKLQDAYDACMDEEKLKTTGSAPLLVVLRHLGTLFPIEGQHKSDEGRSFPQLQTQHQLGISLEEENQLSHTMTYLASIGITSLVAIGIGVGRLAFQQLSKLIGLG